MNVNCYAATNDLILVVLLAVVVLLAMSTMYGSSTISKWFEQKDIKNISFGCFIAAPCTFIVIVDVYVPIDSILTLSIACGGFVTRN